MMIVLTLSGCSLSSQYDSEFFAMDTVMDVTAYGANSEDAVKAVESEINRLDSLLSVDDENSEVYMLNSEKSLSVSDETLSIITCALEVSELTDGAFDITTEPLTRLWGFYSDEDYRVPTEDEIEATLPYVGSEHISIDSNVVTLDKNTCIDLGGIAKGYASKRATEILKENDVTSAIISLGGNVRAVGSKPDGSNWTVAITDPDDNSQQIGTLSVSDRAVITSGGYQRYFEEDSKTYHHIINPKTGYPAQSGLKSVTVVSEDDVLADALSTGMFVMGLEDSSKLYSENSSLFGAVFVSDDGDIYVTDNLAESFSSQYEFEVIKS